MCRGDHVRTPDENPFIEKFLSVIHMIYILVLCLFVLHQDFKLLFFIKKRKAQAGIHPDPAILIPWKVPTKEDEKKISIPLKACIISSTFLILTVIGLILSFRMFRQYQHENQAFFWIWLFFMSIGSCYVLPIVVLFCVKREEKNKKKKTQPPSSLQFHNDTPDNKNPSNLYNGDQQDVQDDQDDHQNQDQETQHQVVAQIHIVNN